MRAPDPGVGLGAPPDQLLLRTFDILLLARHNVLGALKVPYGTSRILLSALDGGLKFLDGRPLLEGVPHIAFGLVRSPLSALFAVLGVAEPFFGVGEARLGL